MHHDPDEYRIFVIFLANYELMLMYCPNFLSYAAITFGYRGLFPPNV